MIQSLWTHFANFNTKEATDLRMSNMLLMDGEIYYQ